jgi:hypothetical protein
VLVSVSKGKLICAMMRDTSFFVPPARCLLATFSGINLLSVFAFEVLGQAPFGSLVLSAIFQVRFLDVEAEPPVAVAAPDASAHETETRRSAQRTPELVLGRNIEQASLRRGFLFALGHVIDARHRFHVSKLRCAMFWASAKFDGAIAVVVSFHQETADALAVSSALPIVAGIIAIMAVAHLSNSPAICSMVVHPRSTVSSKSEKTSSNNRWIDVGVRLRDRDFDGHRLLRGLFLFLAQRRGKA